MNVRGTALVALLVGSLLATGPASAVGGSADCTGKHHVVMEGGGVPSYGSLASGAFACMHVRVAGLEPALHIQLTDPAGVASGLSLYVRYGAPASTTAYDCGVTAPASGTEQCRFDAPKSGDWYVMVRASGEGLAFQLGTSIEYGPCWLTLPGVTWTSYRGDTCFRVRVPTGMPGMRIRGRSPGAISVWREYAYTNQCSSYSSGECIVRSPQAGMWRIYMPYGLYPPYRIRVEFLSDECPVIAAGMHATLPEAFCYAINVPPGTEMLRVGDSDGRFGTVSRSANYRDAAACAFGYAYQYDRKQHYCAVPGPEAGRLYVHLHRYHGSQDLTQLDVRFEDAVVVTERTTDRRPEAGDGRLYSFTGLERRAEIQLVGTEEMWLMAWRGSPAPRFTVGQPGPYCRPLSVRTGLNAPLLATCSIAAGPGPVYAFVWWTPASDPRDPFLPEGDKFTISGMQI